MMMEMPPPCGLPAWPGKLICVGRNYAAHAAEMKSDVPDEPVLFLKPPTALTGHGSAVVLPPAPRDVHHELELVVVIGRRVKHVPVSEALACVSGYALGLDMTARDLQSEAKERGLPWSVAKGFDTFAPLGTPIPASEVGDPQRLALTLQVNGEVRQTAHTSRMLFTVAELVAYSSTIFTLLPGDLLYTGTPEGVARVEDGDRLEVRAEGFPDLCVRVEACP